MTPMMKIKNVFLLAAAMTIAWTVVACSSSEDEIDPEQERGVVKAEFTISFPSKVGSTRMSAATVQDNGQDFRGIKSIELYPFTNVKSDISGTTTIPSMISLAGSTTFGTTGASGTNANEIVSGSLFATNNSHLYQNVDIPIGTKAFMFYGEAIPSTGGNAVNGAINKTSTGTTLAGITFSPQPICPNSVLGKNATSIETYLTKIATATGWETSTNVVLQSLYQSFISMRAGSWASIQGAVQQLYTSLYSRTDDVSVAIKTAITNSTYASESGGTLTFQTLGNYPADINLPDGAAYLNWDDTNKKFQEVTNNSSTGLDATPISSYAYPASLYYYVLSNIVTAEESMESHYNGNDAWKTITDAYGTSHPAVTSKTRSIAILDQVQYAVGRLDVTVKADGTTLADNKTSITVAGTDFPLTGILVGGQKPVDYKFQQTTGTAYTIYDKDISGINLTSSESSSTHTLVFETKDATEENQPDAIVKIALEFENKSNQTIVGYNNQLIYPKTKFYLVGTLDPWKNETQKYDSTGPVIKKAFVQDYTTTANMVIKNLKNAYNTMPDLQAPQLEMGLSVDLSWKTGITQKIEIQ